MIELGLTRAQTEAFEDALVATNQKRRVELGIHNANEKRIDTLVSPETVVLGGAIQVDLTAAVTRSLSLTVTDPRRKLRFDSGSPARGVVYADRFISVQHGIYVDELERWIDVPTFFGPVTGYSQDGGEVTLEAQGKESLLLDPHFATEGYSIKKKTQMDAAIKHVARKAGEGKFDVDDFGHVLKADRVVRPQDEPWKIIAGGTRDPATGASKGLVGWGDTDRICIYDGRGRLVARRMDKNAVYTFGDEGLLSNPTYAFDMLEFRNHVRVTGATPAGKGKRPAKAAVSLPPAHPLSPEALGRNGKPRYLTEFVNAKALKKDEDCEARALEVLVRKAFTGLDAQFECLPIPHLEEGDRVRLQSGKTEITFPLKQFTLPLTVEEPMTIGANRTINQTAKKRRRKPVWFRG